MNRSLRYSKSKHALRNKRRRLPPKRARLPAEELVGFGSDPAIETLEAALAAALDAETVQRERIALADRILKAEQIARLLADADARSATAGPGSPSDVATLQTLSERERELQVRLEAAETIVSLAAQRDLQVTWSQNGTAEPETIRERTTVTRRVDGFVVLSLDGIGTVEVRGPEGDATQLRQQLEGVSSKLRALTKRLGTQDAFELQKRLDAKQQAQSDRLRLSKDLADALDGTTVEELGARLHGLGVVVPDDEQEGARVEELRSALKEASAAQETLRKSKGDAVRTATLQEATAAASAAAAEVRCRTFEDENLRPLKAQLAELWRDGKSQAERDTDLRAAYTARYEGERKRDEARSELERFALGRSRRRVSGARTYGGTPFQRSYGSRIRSARLARRPPAHERARTRSEARGTRGRA